MKSDDVHTYSPFLFSLKESSSFEGMITVENQSFLLSSIKAKGNDSQAFLASRKLAVALGNRYGYLKDVCYALLCYLSFCI